MSTSGDTMSTSGGGGGGYLEYIGGGGDILSTSGDVQYVIHVGEQVHKSL